MTLVAEVRLRKILDSRGQATVEAEVQTEAGGIGRAAAPSGASTGEYEALELPADEAIATAREIVVPRLEGTAFAGDQRGVDNLLRAADGTTNFAEIGANAAVAISMATAKAAANTLGIPLYQHLGGTFRGRSTIVPLGNVIGGGAHAADATDIQEFLVAPIGAPSIADAVFANAAVHEAVGEILADRNIPAAKGDEGAWAPSISDDEAFEIAETAIETIASDVGFELKLGLDMAAAELYDDGQYIYSDTVRSPADQESYVTDLIESYELVYVEDPFDEDDFERFASLTASVSEDTSRHDGTSTTLICGDDLFVTNTDRLQTGIDVGAANSILIKPNQIGTLTDTFDAIELARQHGYTPVISHRSGETEDTTIAHLAAAVAAPFIKTGAVGGERTAKLNELLRIEAQA